MIITSIEQAKKNIDRANIFLDGEFWVGLDKNDILTFKLHKDKTISEEEKREIEKSSQMGKIKNRILNYIFIRPHSKREIIDHFKIKADIQKENLYSIVEGLEEQNIISDLEFAKWYIEGRLASGKHGANKIRAELMKKGVERKFIEIAMFEKTNSDEYETKLVGQIRTYIEKLTKSIKTKNPSDFKNKMIQRLMSRGFKFDDIKKALRITSDE
ncbi:MAG: RecX family transcriptional regulator [Candidatus Dojkabacteria bacterium]